MWRFLDFEKFVYLIEKSTLFHSRLDQLGDPFESAVTSPYAKKRASGEMQGYMPAPEPAEAHNNRRLMLTSFVSCWHANDHESAAMWKLYAHEHRGVAIVSTVRRLIESVDVGPFEYGMLGPVEYFDFEQDDMSLTFGLVGRPGFSKRKAFEHEREVRGMIRLKDIPDNLDHFLSNERIDGLKRSMPLGVGAHIDLTKLIHKIYTNPHATDWFLDLVQLLVGRHGLGDTVCESTLRGHPEY